MTNLERLIKAHTEGAVITTVTTATEKVAEEMARELLKDPTFRAEMQTLVRTHFTATLRALGRNGRRRTKKGAR